MIPKEIRFKVINKLSHKYGIVLLCHLAKVSLSWYYKYRIRINPKWFKEDQSLVKIKELVIKYNYKHWYRMITMLLAKQWKKMNHKKVYRIMKKNNLLSIIRKKNPYKLIQKATQEHRTMRNILNMNFWWLLPFTKLWTDITYIKFDWKWIYLSIVKDIISWEVLTYQISDNLWLEIVHKTIDKLPKKLIKWAILHSDQWFHYTHPSYIKMLKEIDCIQSMSRKWNCLDNSPTESFFWHLKDELSLSNCSSLKDVENEIDKYIFYYNNHRPQRNKKKMTPVEYRNHLILNKY